MIKTHNNRPKTPAGRFITFEGTDGVGKSTQIKLLASHLQKSGHAVLVTREPGGPALSEKIRALLLDARHSMHARTELLLYLAARSEHIEATIKPALRKGIVVLCDRFSDATMAYQAYARGLGIPFVKRLLLPATGGFRPHLTFWLDHSVKAGLNKAIRKKGKADRLEAEGAPFLERVRDGYAKLQREEPDRIVRIPVQPTIGGTHKRLQSVLKRKLGL